MAKARLRVKRLTLAPLSNLCADKDDEEDQAQLCLDRERLSRAIDLSVAAGEGNRIGNHKHGVEPNFTSKFWAKDGSSSDSEEDDASSESVEDVTTPMLVSEALKASFSLKQIKQAEAELDSPSSLTSKVCSELK
jgi:hypothetical protein